MSPDIWNSSVITALFVSILAGLHAAVWWKDETYPGFGRWTGAMVLFSISMFGVALNPPTLIWILVIAPALNGAFIFALEGCREFRGLAPRIPIVYLTAVVVCIVAGYFEYARKLNARISVMSAFFVLIAILSAVALLRNIPLGQAIGSRFTGGIFVAFALAAMVRVAYYQLAPPMTDFYEMSWAGVASNGASTLFLVGCMLGWLLMAYERRLSEVKTAQANANLLTQRSAAADASKTELMAMIGHEVRSPLAGTLATCDLMQSTDLTSEQREYTLMVDSSLRALLRLTDDILDLSQMESGVLKIESSTFDPRCVIGDAAKIVAPLVSAKGLSLNVEFSEGLPACVSGDAGRIRQVVMNLLTNAVKFTSQGNIGVDVRYGAQGGGAQGELQVAVMDTGVGMPPDMVETLFTKGRPARARTSRVYGGAGIGLTISQRLVERMGGRLEVESEIGRGSTFRILQPCRVYGLARSAGHS